MSIWFGKSRGGNGGGSAPDNPLDSRCSFCGRFRAVVGPMVEGPNNVYICVECVRLAHEIAEGNRVQPVAADLSDPQVRRSAHMHVRCYFRLQRVAAEQWRAVSESPEGFAGEGRSPREAVKAMQKAVLAAAAPALNTDVGPGHWFTDHAEERLR